MGVTSTVKKQSKIQLFLITASLRTPENYASDIFPPVNKAHTVSTLKNARVEEPAKQPYSITFWLARSSKPFTFSWVDSEVLEDLRLEK